MVRTKNTKKTVDDRFVKHGVSMPETLYTAARERAAEQNMSLSYYISKIVAKELGVEE